MGLVSSSKMFPPPGYVHGISGVISDEALNAARMQDFARARRATRSAKATKSKSGTGTGRGASPPSPSSTARAEQQLSEAVCRALGVQTEQELAMDQTVETLISASALGEELVGLISGSGAHNAGNSATTVTAPKTATATTGTGSSPTTTTTTTTMARANNSTSAVKPSPGGTLSRSITGSTSAIPPLPITTTTIATTTTNNNNINTTKADEYPTTTNNNNTITKPTATMMNKTTKSTIHGDTPNPSTFNSTTTFVRLDSRTLIRNPHRPVNLEKDLEDLSAQLQPERKDQAPPVLKLPKYQTLSTRAPARWQKTQQMRTKQIAVEEAAWRRGEVQPPPSVTSDRSNGTEGWIRKHARR